jgi:outer membrane protein with beta-barrel domain
MALVSFEARAQMSMVKPVQFGIAAGAAIPLSDFKDSHNTGFNGTVTAALSPAMIPLGIRIDGAYNQFGIKGLSGENARIFSVTGNFVYKIPAVTVSPYAIGGAGWYNEGTSVSGDQSTNNFGWNLGGGIMLPLSGFQTFIEARYNQIQVSDLPSIKFVPITFGIMF